MIIKQLITFFTLILLSSQIDCQLSYDSFGKLLSIKWGTKNKLNIDLIKCLLTHFVDVKTL